MYFRKYGSTTDWSGGGAHELGFTDSGNLYKRYGTSTSWGSWNKLLDSANYGSYSTFSGAISASNLSGTNTGNQTHGGNGVSLATSFASMPSSHSGFHDNWNTSDLPSGMSHVHGASFRHHNNTSNSWGWQMVAQYNSPGEIRARWVDAGTFSSWYSVLTSSGGTLTGNLTAPRFNVDNGSNYIDTVSNYLSFTSGGNEMTIGGATSMYINYRAANGGTPTEWYWKAGSSGSWAQQHFGSVTANGTITSTGGITTGVSADIKRTGINNTKYISLSGHLSGYGVNDYPTLKTNFHVLYFDAGGVYTGYITSTGGFTDQSDRSLKENIEDIPDALSKVMNLRGRYFTWINELQGNERQVGFIAQEVEEQLPEVVSVGAGDTKGVAYGKVTALLVNAMKEQQAQIELLKQEVELLKQ